MHWTKPKGRSTSAVKSNRHGKRRGYIEKISMRTNAQCIRHCFLLVFKNMFVSPKKGLESQTVHARKKKDSFRIASNIPNKTTAPDFLFNFFFFASNIKILLFLGIFELLTGKFKSKENERENKKSGGLVLLRIFQGFQSCLFSSING